MRSVGASVGIAFLVTGVIVAVKIVLDLTVMHDDHGDTPHEGELRDLLLHAFTTALLVLPPTLVACLTIRRSTLLTDELTRLVNRDRLTDAATRDYFFSRLADGPDVYGVSLMVDIDNFKQVNDSFGHLAGDEVIRIVARCLRDEMRETDIVCRFGGEEFVVFLHRSDEAEGWRVAERVRERIAAATADCEGGPIHVTVSIGGSLKHAAEAIDDSVRRADACLYAAKAGGRNRTVVDWSTGTGRAA